MKKNSRREQQKQRREGKIAVLIAVAILLVIFFFLLVLPWIHSARMLPAYVERIDRDAVSCVLLQNPRYPTMLKPEPVEAVLDSEAAEEMLSHFVDVAGVLVYDSKEYVMGGLWTCFMRVDFSGSAVFFYFTEDYVAVEQNSTYYRFTPKTNAGREAYAEWYADAIAYIDAAAGKTGR